MLLDFESPVPIYRQIASDLRRRIASGRLPVGARSGRACSRSSAGASGRKTPGPSSRACSTRPGSGSVSRRRSARAPAFEVRYVFDPGELDALERELDLRPVESGTKRGSTAGPARSAASEGDGG